MALESKTKEIGGVRVTVTQFPVMTQLEMLPRIDNTVGTALIHKVSSGLSLVSAQLKPDELRALVRDLLACSQAEVNGKLLDLNSEQNIARAFEGDLKALTDAAMFAAEVNFGPFFDAGLAEAEAAGGKASD